MLIYVERRTERKGKERKEREGKARKGKGREREEKGGRDEIYPDHMYYGKVVEQNYTMKLYMD